jgi:D-alanyl-D-alanine dipeptidase
MFSERPDRLNGYIGTHVGAGAITPGEKSTSVIDRDATDAIFPGHPLVRVTNPTHDVLIDLIYATPDNVAGQTIYQRPVCLIHRDAEACLRRAVTRAAQAGCRLKIFDAFRPHEAQVILWDTAPDKAYVADPRIGSNHTRGTAVDLTLADNAGQELDMGTAFDDMTSLSHHFCDRVSPEAQANRLLLLEIMKDAGFEPIPHEWWHYALPDWERYPLIASATLGRFNPMLAA